jgi:hypothetical protein
MYVANSRVLVIYPESLTILQHSENYVGRPLDSEQEADGAERLDEEDIQDEMTQEDELLATATSQIHLYEAIVRIEEQEVEVFGRGADEEPAVFESRIENVRIVQQYIQAISSATLEHDTLNREVIYRLRNPIKHEVDISDPDLRLSLDLFLACSHALEATYNSACTAIRRRFPDTDMLSHHLAKKAVETISSVVSVVDDMCINSCQAFTGPLANNTTCSECGEACYHESPGKSRQQVCTIPLGPQIQALRRSKTGALSMHFRDRKTREILERLDAGKDPLYDDIFSGSDFLDFAERVQLGPNDTTLTFSLDGAQLYQNKKSDTWIGVWIINNYDPTTHYKKKHILPALVIPGPNKPKNIDSFTYRSFYHLSALQHENDWKGL